MSATLILNTGAPQGCVLSLLLSLFSHDCVAKYDSHTIIKFAVNTKVVGLITDNDETAYREEVRDLMVQGQQPLPQCDQDKEAGRGLQENAGRTGGAVVERVESFKFLGVHIPNYSWDIMLEAHQDSREEGMKNLFPLRRRKIYSMGPQILKMFYSCTIKSILTCCITAWYGNCSASDHKALHRVVCTAQYITGAKLPAI
jgi:hypothetical protein